MDGDDDVRQWVLVVAGWTRLLGLGVAGWIVALGLPLLGLV